MWRKYTAPFVCALHLQVLSDYYVFPQSDWFSDWLIDSLIDWLILWLIDWLIDWLINWMRAHHFLKYKSCRFISLQIFQVFLARWLLFFLISDPRAVLFWTVFITFVLWRFRSKLVHFLFVQSFHCLIEKSFWTVVLNYWCHNCNNNLLIAAKFSSTYVIV